MTITGLASNHSAVKIYFAPVPGAKDYRVYDVNSPTSVKYAGLTHLGASPNCPGTGCLHHFVAQADGVTPVYPYRIATGPLGGPQVLDVPSTQIDWNNVGDGNPHTLILEAVDQLGPVPLGSLYTGEQNVPLAPGGMLGSNKGPTGDGKTSTNGQGPYTNNPQAIAQSTPFVVQADRTYVAIPSKASAQQTFFDTFENSEAPSVVLVSRNDTVDDAFGNHGAMKYSMNAGTPKAWEIEYRRANNRDSMPFITSDHFMDMLFDGATPPAQSHTIYGSMAMSPLQTLNMSGGRMVHLTMEVDGPQTGRRWMAFQLAPASDPLKGWHHQTEPISNSNQGLFLEFNNGFCTLDVFTGPTAALNVAPTGTAGGVVHGARLWGLGGSFGGGAVLCGWDETYVRNSFSKNGLGLDNKSRFDFFITERHAALFQDGQLIVQSDIPAGSFPWANVPLKAYYSHYMYHSSDDVFDLKNVQINGQNICYPQNSYWFNDPVLGTLASDNVCNASYPAGYGFPNSDERHWDNMGFEVLPASDVPGNSFLSLGSLVQPPLAQIGPRPAAPSNLRVIR